MSHLDDFEPDRSPLGPSHRGDRWGEIPAAPPRSGDAHRRCRERTGGRHGQRAATSTAKLSIVIPTKNRSHLLRRALAPLAGRDGFEIIVVDDGSAPNHAIENRSACAAVPGCLYVRCQQSRGGAAARNRGLAASTGPMVWFLDDDDFATESTLDDVATEVARGDARRVLLMPRATLLDGTTIRVDVPANEPDKFELYRQAGIEVTTSCAIFPRWVLQQVGGWDEQLPALQDTDLLLRVARIAKFTCVRTDPVRVDTSHPVRITSSLLNSTVGKARFLRKHWHTLSVRRRVRYLVQLLGCSSLTRGARLRWQLFKVRRAERFATGANGLPSSLPR